MAGAWAQARDDLVDELRQVAEEILKDTQAPVTPAVLRRDIRLRRALTKVERELRRLLQVMGEDITPTVRDMAGLGVTTTERLTAAQIPHGARAAVMAEWAAPYEGAITALVQRSVQAITQDWDYLPVQVRRNIQGALIRSMSAGEHPTVAARRMVTSMGQAFDFGGARALTVARTEMLDAYRQADKTTRKENASIIRGWVWATALDKRTCPACLAMNGREFPNDVAGPEGHQNCRCTSIPLTRSFKSLGLNVPEPPSPVLDAQAWYRNLDTASQKAIMGPTRWEMLNRDPDLWDSLASKKSNSGWRDSHVTTPIINLVRRAA